MLLKNRLLAEYRDVITTILHATTLDRSDVSRDLIASIIVRSMKTSRIKEPSKSPIYTLALALREYQKAGTWPPKFSEFIDELRGLTSLPASTIRSSLNVQAWDVPIYLRPKSPKKKGPYLDGKVNILNVTNESSQIAQQEFSAESNIKPAIDTSIKVMEIGSKCNDDIIKLNDNYHVVIDFGAFKITIEKEKPGKVPVPSTSNWGEEDGFTKERS